MDTQIKNSRRKLLAVTTAGLLTAVMSSSALAGFDSNIIRGPVTFSPGARIKLDCPRDSNAPPVLSDVQGFGHVSAPVKFKIVYSPSPNGTKNDVPGTEEFTKDYIKALNNFLGNFPGPGYYALVMRNTNNYPVTLITQVSA